MNFPIFLLLPVHRAGLLRGVPAQAVGYHMEMRNISDRCLGVTKGDCHSFLPTQDEKSFSHGVDRSHPCSFKQWIRSQKYETANALPRKILNHGRTPAGSTANKASCGDSILWLCQTS